MKYLLDTHALLWWEANDPQLSAVANAIIKDPSNEIFVSAVSAWEVAIKVGIGKLSLPMPAETYVADCIAANHFYELPVTVAHAASTMLLPLHHRDPFDRLIIAQSISEGLTLLSADTAFEPYPVTVVW